MSASATACLQPQVHKSNQVMPFEQRVPDSILLGYAEDTSNPPPVSDQDQEDEEVFVARDGSSGSRPNYEVTDPLAPISGYTNYTPGEMVVVSEWKRRLADTYRCHGFTGIELRPVEYASNLLKKGGISKQIYGLSRLQDGGLTKLGLPFDRTVQLALFVAQHASTIVFPYRRADIGLAFRGEKASKGRYRAFLQCDIDIIDRRLTSRADGEAIGTMLKGLEALGVPRFRLLLNHVVIAKAFIRNAGVIDNERIDAALRIIDKLKPGNQSEVVDELVRDIGKPLDRDAARQLLEGMSYCGPVEDFANSVTALSLGAEAVDALVHLREVEKTCLAMGIAREVVCFAPYLTRGLDYYTGVVFETFMVGREKYGSIASGGRYDKLVDGFSENETGLEGVGGSIGLTRLFDVMKLEEAVDLTRQTTATVFVGYRTLEQGCYEQAVRVASALRARNIAAELYTGARVKVADQLKLCDRKGIPLSVMVMNADELQCKTLANSQMTTATTVDDIVAVVAKHVQAL